MKPPPPKLVAAVYAAVAVLSLWNAAGFVQRTKNQAGATGDPYGVWSQNSRFQPLRNSLGNIDTLGYVPDPFLDGPGQEATHAVVRYELAPHLVLGAGGAGPAPRFLVGCFSRSFDLQEFARAQGLQVVQDFGNGVVLFQRAGPP